MRRTLRQLFSLIAIAAALTGLAAAQLSRTSVDNSVTQITLGQSAVPLYGPWKFTVGDSPIDAKTGKPLWAEPDFDDSKWETVDLTPKDGAVDPSYGLSGYVPGWTAKGHPGYSGYAWYRIRVRCQGAGGGALALAGPASQDDAYQVFADGKLLGAFGDFSTAEPVIYYTRPVQFRLPESSCKGSPSEATPAQVLAFRFWMAPGTQMSTPDAGGMHKAPWLGEADVIALQTQSQWLDLFRGDFLLPIEAAIYALFALIAFSLILFDRSDPVYLWIGLLFLVEGARNGLVAVADWTHLISVGLNTVVAGAITASLYLLWGMVWWVWFGRAGFRRLPWILGCLAVLYALMRTLAHEVIPGLISHAVALRLYTVTGWLRFVFFGFMVWIVIGGIRRKGIEGWLALPVILMLGFALFSTDLALLHLIHNWTISGVVFGPVDVLDTLVAVVIALLLLRRLLQSVKRQREMAMDVKQAQEVQQVILPEARLVLPGLTIESEYRPAREVGGDFFQIIPHRTDGSVLIVAGDVTGKGLQAGMLVALLVGAIRSTNDWSTDPVVMLRALNQRLMGRGDAQATCLALRIEADGSATLANAGHVAPYLNGEELPMEGALPLGIFEGAESSAMRFQLKPGDRLVLMSDGVAEAMDESGKLFGFERVHALLRAARSAPEVASAAQAFGQEDDISVIAVTRMEAATAAMVL
jgi:hypothetical protein